MSHKINDLVDANRCIRDLVALSMSPAVWGGGDCLRAAQGIADTLFSILRPTLVYVSLVDNGATTAEVVRTAKGWCSDEEEGEIARVLAPWLREHDINEARVIHDPIEPGMARLFVMPIGAHGHYGFLAVVSPLVRFPDEVDRLLLSVAASQAAMAVQNTRLIARVEHSETQQRAASSLKVRLQQLLDDEAADLTRMRANLASLLNNDAKQISND